MYATYVQEPMVPEEGIGFLRAGVMTGVLGTQLSPLENISSPSILFFETRFLTNPGAHPLV